MIVRRGILHGGSIVETTIKLRRQQGIARRPGLAQLGNRCPRSPCLARLDQGCAKLPAFEGRSTVGSSDSGDVQARGNGTVSGYG